MSDRAVNTSKSSYRRRAVLGRIHSAMDAFYLLQRIDWEFDMRTTLDRIVALAVEDLSLGEGRQIERALLIIRRAAHEELEVHAGWRVESLEDDLAFSRTVVQQALDLGNAILCENAKEDPRFHEAESLKKLTTLSLICVPIKVVDRVIGALYIESHSPKNIFSEDDLEFLGEFTTAIAPYLKTALIHQEHVDAIQKLRAEIRSRYGFDTIVGRSKAMLGVFEMIKVAAKIDRCALITGESGCGKELVARAIHDAGPRSQAPFVVVDCSALADHLLESELFGHVEGSFTGASADKVGAFEEADGGTIFLDEISDAPKQLQQMLRRVLQEGEIRRVGENTFHKVDVRVICATNKSLPELVEKGEFIRDLYYRINRVPITLPPLRERREDIPPLIHHFLEHAVRGGEVPSITEDAVELLARLDWPENNVRELRNVVELATDLATGGVIDDTTVERVLRIQRGEPIAAPAFGELRLEAASDAAATPPAPGGLVRVQRDAFTRLLARSREDTASEKRLTPFYLLQQELAARAVIEGLRAQGWKLRPAAKLLGISPTKLRGTLKEALEKAMQDAGGDLAQAAANLEIPLEVLEKKAGDLGLEAGAS